MSMTTWDDITCVRPGCDKPRAENGVLCREHTDSAMSLVNGSGTMPRVPRSVEFFKQEEANRREALRQLAVEEAGTIEIPEFTNLAAFLDEPDNPTPFRITGVLPSGGRVILTAEKKAGKTTTTMNLIRSLADGDPFLGAYPTERVSGSVTLIDTEMSRDQLRGWLRKQGIRNVDHVEVLTLRGRTGTFRITNPEVRAMWAEELRARNTEVLIIDPLGPIFAANDIDENSNTDVGKILDTLDALTVEAGASELILTHHAGHNAERARGASRLRGWPDAELLLLVEKDEFGNPLPNAKRFFWAYGRDVDVPESELAFDPATSHLRIAGDSIHRPMSRKQAARERALDFIERLIKEQPGCITGQITGPGIHERNRAGLINELIIRKRIYVRKEGRATRHYPGPDPEESPFKTEGEE